MTPDTPHRWTPPWERPGWAPGDGGPLLAWQQAAVAWALDPDAPPVLAINGGIGCGKSWLLAYLLCVVSRTRPGAASALLSDSWPSIQGNNLGPLLRLTQGQAAWRASDRVFEFPNGATIELRHYRLAEGAAESANPIEGRNFTGIVVADEAQKLRPLVLDHALSRCRGHSVDTRGQRWAPRVIMNGRPDAGRWWWEQRAHEVGGVVLKPRTIENPHNGPEYLANLERTLTPAMFLCVTEGQPAPAEGGVFADFTEAPFPAGNLAVGWRYDPGAPVSVGIDFGRRTPAVVWVQRAQVAGETVDVIFDEAAPDETTTQRLVSAILAPWASRWPGARGVYGAEPGRWRVDVAYTDPAGGARSVQTGKSELDILRRAEGVDPDGLGGGLGCRVVTTTAPEKASVTAGLGRLAGAFCPATGARRLLVTEELWRRGREAPANQRTLTRAILGLTWKHAERKAAGGSESEHTHHIDALRYWYIGARWGPPALPVVSGSARVATVAPR